MELAGLVKIESDQPELIDHAARVISESFLEEPWYEEWLKAIDGIDATRERKLEIVTAAFRGEFRTHAAYPFAAQLTTNSRRRASSCTSPTS